MHGIRCKEAFVLKRSFERSVTLVQIIRIQLHLRYDQDPNIQLVMKKDDDTEKADFLVQWLLFQQHSDVFAICRTCRSSLLKAFHADDLDLKQNVFN